MFIWKWRWLLLKCREISLALICTDVPIWSISDAKLSVGQFTICRICPHQKIKSSVLSHESTWVTLKIQKEERERENDNAKGFKKRFLQRELQFELLPLTQERRVLICSHVSPAKWMDFHGSIWRTRYSLASNGHERLKLDSRVS